jgi:6-pyruvoyl-tetrahydropterin synthase
MNYTEITNAIKEYTDNTETTFVNNIPNFVRQTEERIYRSILIPELRKNVTTSLSTSNRFLAKPTDFLAVFSIAVVDGSSNYSFLLPKDVNFIREAYPATATSGLPVYYSLFDGDNFLIAPTPDSTYTVQLHYYYDPPSIVTSSTSWLGDNAEATLLYGTLVEAYTFMKGEADIISFYKTRYDEAMAGLQQLADGRNKRDSYRNGEPRIM